jgi:hypothetical protein
VALVIRIEVKGTEEFRKLARDLRAAGDGRLTRRMSARMQRAAVPLLGSARNNALGIAAEGPGTGLRASTAAATRIAVVTRPNAAGVTLRTVGSRMPPSQRNLPPGMNRGRVRHPVRGNRRVWVTQLFTPAGWFDRAAKADGPPVREAAGDALNEIIAEVANG